MEGNTHLLQVIRKMRSQINKLERENRALKGELQICGQRAVPPVRQAAREGGNGNMRSLASGEEGPADSPAFLHGSIVTGPAPAPKKQTDTTMTVRRYSTASPAPGPSNMMSHRAGKRSPSNELPDTPGSALAPAPPTAAQLTSGEEKGLERTPVSSLSHSPSSKMKLFRDHVYKCRGKVKAISFLLPMDMSSSAEKQGSLQSPQNHSTKQLTTMAEKDI
ncbi:putative coiled-coil domain-containing protein 195 [Phaenicophaeus curvirostris]|uniref:putative coiled-coil domain-containing protein 195 n=1 Tax=Phaenicophaeus curvirostris TaxID=33595 RepID=UPI0037F0B54A